MIRTQMYLDSQTHKDLVRLAELQNRSMAKVARDILKAGIQHIKTADTSGSRAMRIIANIGAKADDPFLSENIDHYLYGGPKQRT
jgi:hypothetical protein